MAGIGATSIGVEPIGATLTPADSSIASLRGRFEIQNTLGGRFCISASLRGIMQVTKIFRGRT